MGFSNNLRVLLKAKNLKQADLCRLTKIPTSLMSDYLGSKKSPTIKNAVLIADALNTSLDFLVSKNTCCDLSNPFPAESTLLTSSSSLKKDFLDVFKNLTHDSQMQLLNIAQDLYKKQNQINPPSVKIGDQIIDDPEIAAELASYAEELQFKKSLENAPSVLGKKEEA